MVPTTEALSIPIEDVKYSNRTYRINGDLNKISGYIEDVDAIMQSAYLILNIERYQYPIYSWNYGVELLDLFGQPTSYVVSELERRVREALMQDERITDVTDFECEVSSSKIHVKFNVVCEYGEITMETDFEQGGVLSGV